MQINYAREDDVSLEEFVEILEKSGLGERRPMYDPNRLRTMLDRANLIVTARNAETHELIGVARCLTDFAWCCYCSELAVDKRHQGHGIGTNLLNEVVRMAPGLKTYLLISAPGAVTFYEQSGFERIGDTFRFHPSELG